MDDKILAQAKIASELRAIIAVLTERLGLPSRWSGHVEIVRDAGFKGKKRFTCDILIDAALASQEVRWATLVHEALHTLSAGYIGTDYRDFPGWEERVIERLQRLFRPVILAKLGIIVPKEMFKASEEKHNYNKYIQALEQIRLGLNLTTEEFYVNLINIPIKERSGYVFSLGDELEGRNRTVFLYTLSSANSVLKDFT
jgi:hypothetical protein